jgi:hypothetical protein
MSRKPAFKKGWSYQVRFSWSMDIYRIHVLEIVENDMIVYKYFGRRKQWWHYSIERRSSLEMYYKWAKDEKREKNDKKN